MHQEPIGTRLHQATASATPYAAGQKVALLPVATKRCPKNGRRAGAPAICSNGLARWIVRLMVVAAVGFALTGCPSLSPRAESPPSWITPMRLRVRATRWAQLICMRRSPHRTVAQIATSICSRSAAFLADTARRGCPVLAELNSHSPPNRPLKAFVGCRAGPRPRSGPTGLAENQHAAEPRTAPEALHYWRLRQQAGFASGRPNDGVGAQISLEHWLPSRAGAADRVVSISSPRCASKANATSASIHARPPTTIAAGWNWAPSRRQRAQPKRRCRHCCVRSRNPKSPCERYRSQ